VNINCLKARAACCITSLAPPIGVVSFPVAPLSWWPTGADQIAPLKFWLDKLERSHPYLTEQRSGGLKIVVVRALDQTESNNLRKWLEMTGTNCGVWAIEYEDYLPILKFSGRVSH